MKKPDRLFHSPDLCNSLRPGELSFHCHRIRETPVGDLVIFYRTAPFLVHRIFLPGVPTEQWGNAFSENDANRSASPKIIQIARSLFNYLQGNPASPGPVPWHLLYLENLSPLQVQVLRKTSAIPYAKTASYKAIAKAIGRPRAYRFVGTALSVNPFPILIPCHRVIRSDTSPGEYGGGRPLKRWLLSMEACNIKN